jgi:hypothetical protein
VPVIVPGTWSQCLEHGHSAWDIDTVPNLDRYQLGDPLASGTKEIGSTLMFHQLD